MERDSICRFETGKQIEEDSFSNEKKGLRTNENTNKFPKIINKEN